MLSQYAARVRDGTRKPSNVSRPRRLVGWSLAREDYVNTPGRHGRGASVRAPSQ